MPSPFPGMDPFLESQAWEDFHHALNEVVREQLIVQVRPRYVVRVEKRVYVEHEAGEFLAVVRPDLSVIEIGSTSGESTLPGTTATAIAPVLLTLPMPETRRETFLTVRERDTLEVVTVIEVLSPSNKRPGSDGRRDYLAKREAILQSKAHLVELDLLRGGLRLPTIEPLPSADYYAFVCRRQDRPRVEVYPWQLRQRMPPIPVPLAAADPDVRLDLQDVFATVYNRAGYDYSLDYRSPVEPPLDSADLLWTQERLDSANSAGG